jgi:hypothetical protein
MDDATAPAAYDPNSLHPMDEEDREHDDLSDGIDWDEITATTQPDWEAGRFAFDSADYPTDEAADAAMYALLRSIEEKVYEEIAATAVDAARF